MTDAIGAIKSHSLTVSPSLCLINNIKMLNLKLLGHEDVQKSSLEIYGITYYKALTLDTPSVHLLEQNKYATSL